MPMFVMLSLGGLFGKVGGFVAKQAGRFFSGGPISVVRGGIQDVAGLLGGGREPNQTFGISRSLAPSRATSQSFAPRGAGPPPAQMKLPEQARQNAAAIGLVCPPGERPNKSRYHLLSGQLVEPGTRCVKSRRIDVGNATALRRSIRRENGFAKLAKRVLRGSRFKVTSASAGTRRGPRTIVESGPGSVVTR